MKVSASDTAIDALHKLLPSMGLGHVTYGHRVAILVFLEE